MYIVISYECKLHSLEKYLSYICFKDEDTIEFDDVTLDFLFQFIKKTGIWSKVILKISNYQAH